MRMEQKYQEGPILALDTSTASMAAAIVNGHEVLAEIQTLAERNHSVNVVKHIKEMLLNSGVTDAEIEAVAVGNGPGSYTGMRIAVSVAKTLAWVWNKPLVGVSSLEALAYGAWHQNSDAQAEQMKALEGEHWVLPIMDARRGQVYSSGFSMTNNAEWSRWSDDGVRLMKDFADQLEQRLARQPAGAVRSISLVGDLSLHEEGAQRLQQIGDSAGVIVRLQPFVQEGKWIAILGRSRLEAGLTEDPHTFIPNYTQLTEAEVVWKAKQEGEAKV